MAGGFINIAVPQTVSVDTGDFIGGANYFAGVPKNGVAALSTADKVAVGVLVAFGLYMWSRK